VLGRLTCRRCGHHLECSLPQTRTEARRRVLVQPRARGCAPGLQQRLQGWAAMDLPFSADDGPVPRVQLLHNGFGVWRAQVPYRVPPSATRVPLNPHSGPAMGEWLRLGPTALASADHYWGRWYAVGVVSTTSVDHLWRQVLRVVDALQASGMQPLDPAGSYAGPVVNTAHTVVVHPGATPAFVHWPVWRLPGPHGNVHFAPQPVVAPSLHDLVSRMQAVWDDAEARGCGVRRFWAATAVLDYRGMPGCPDSTLGG
jgi:hypothetical protein